MKINKKEGFIILILLIIFTSIIIIRPLDNLDEMWNYNFAKNIVEGNLPYKDFNMITTPLLPNLCAIFLALLGNELVVMRVLTIILSTLIIFITYKILKTLKINEWINYAFLIFCIYLLKDIYYIDYNFFVLFIDLCLIYLEIKALDNIKVASKKDVFLGILAGICICTKQTTGILIAVILIFYNIYYVSNLKEARVFIKKAIYRLIGVLIPIMILVLYLTYFNLWNDFIDYCILGPTTFSNSIPYSNLILNCNIFIKILSILVTIFLITLPITAIIYKCKKKEFDKSLLIIIAYSIAGSIVAYPIFDSTHFLIAIFPAMIGIVYLVNILARKIKSDMIKQYIKEYIKAFIIIIIITYLLTAVTIIFNYLLNAGQYTKLNHFKYIIQLQEQTDNIIKMEEFIQQQDRNVYILDASSAMYTIPINKYTKNFDMFVKGNFGGKGESGIIEYLQNEENYILLIKNNQYSRNWQNPEEVRKYIIQNMKKIGEIDSFDIYEK